MKVSGKVKDWLAGIDNAKYKCISDLINSDISVLKKGISELVLDNKVSFEGNWSDYVLDDVNFNYEEDILKFRDLVENLYGIDLDIIGMHPLSVGDIGIAVSYQYNLYDLYGNVMDTVNAFHLSVSVPELKMAVNRWFVI